MSGVRSFTAFLLGLIAVLATVVAVPAVWADSHIVDQGQFTEMMAPLGRDQAVQDAMAVEIAQQVQRLMTEQGDSRPPMRLVQPVAERFVRSDAFPPAFSTAVASIHTWLFVAPTAEQRLAGATVAEIDLAPMIRHIVDTEADLEITVPARVTVDLSAAGNSRDLFRAGRLEPIAAAVSRTSWIAPLVALVAGIGALLLARRRGFPLMLIGIGVAVGAGVTWLLCGVAPSMVVSAAGGADSMTAVIAGAATERVTGSLTPWVLAEAAVAGALALVGLLFGLLGAAAHRRAERRGWTG